MNDSGNSLIDNERVKLADILRKEAPKHKHLSIATGYWDLRGTTEIIDQIKNYDSIRLLIGSEPLSSRQIDIDNLYKDFPDDDFTKDLQDCVFNKDSNIINKKPLKNEEIDELRNTAALLAKLIRDKHLEVRVMRKPFLHAKAYIFGDSSSKNAVGIVGSSNFTYKGLCANAELNATENDSRIVLYKPVSDDQPFGYLAWFDHFWDSPNAEPWTGEFSDILRDSPVGDRTFGPYDMYIKTLMEVFPDELELPAELSEDTKDVLYSYQNRNAGILINKLNKYGTAILADSVGLGKTVTAGAVIKHYISTGRNRIIVLPPASLREQWSSDLRNIFSLMDGQHYKLLSQQDTNTIEKERKKYEELGVEGDDGIDLFVIDEAHNLRNNNSERHKYILDWLAQNPNSSVLMLTATPINNSLMDLASLIQLGLKGRLNSIQVPVYDEKKKIYMSEDFFDALRDIQKESNREGNKFNWDKYRTTLVSGISHYLVRSTRQGVEGESALGKDKDGNSKHFPKSTVQNISYSYPTDVSAKIAHEIDDRMRQLTDVNVRQVDINKLASDSTQRSAHPLDLIKQYLGDNTLTGVIPNMFQLIALLGFAPYRPEIYRYKYYKHTPEEINGQLVGARSDTKNSIRIQLSVHNMLQITLLKRLESSTGSLQKSIQKYLNNLTKFKKWLDEGYILTLSDINLLENKYDDDIENAFSDFEDSANDETGENIKQGVECREADPSLYNLTQLRRDIDRDYEICQLMIDCLSQLSGKNDPKLVAFVHKVNEIRRDAKYGQKILVFSFFADTISYINENIAKIDGIDAAFMDSAGFTSNKRSRETVDDLACRFSPESKHYDMAKHNATPINTLFATDVLSEGQNLQDAGILINYDLHWNPVRMIQRNGRINRIGSKFDSVLISNMIPENHIEAYLNLVKRLQRKISGIKNTIGLDQGVLDNNDINPIEYIDDLKKLYSNDSTTATNTMDVLSKDDDPLSWTNDHVFVLRNFLKEHTDAEIQRIKRIPLGKWGYLPAKSNYPLDNTICLVTVTGTTSVRHEQIRQTSFIEVCNNNAWAQGSLMDDQKALDIIQTTPDDNQRQNDRINHSREEIITCANDAARYKMETSKKTDSLKPAQKDTLLFMYNLYYKDSADNIQSIVEHGLTNAILEQKFNHIVREIRKYQKDNSVIPVNVITKFDNLIKSLKEYEIESIQAKGIEGVLYYVKNNGE